MINILRYNRHVKLYKNFEKIRESKVLVAGAGGLGCNVLMHLSRLGVGELYIYDDGIVDMPDLNRQILYDIEDLGKTKVFVAKEKLNKINPYIKIHIFNEKITNKTTLPDVNVAIDCFDNFESRKILDKKIHEKKIPLIHGGVERFFGQVTDIIPGKTKTLREILGNIKDSKEIKLVVPYSVSIIASIQVSETMKLIFEDYENMLINKMLIVDLYFNSFEVIELK
ncbi:Molybdopterin or thiamine biosynthesis adenylyltransferase [Marinitoga hydrogenitolerans DSM 16785]|uniref:Molybdopterin or thiamine biosynthesis adenylyltransferase n=1 Tax=Marinitoga hydrogenitolerans (strain DSM 16785 / JCM 12826 / AT1271) TaxID=1122195 RepID=A0A1M5A410_MARH1|nr:HesA/MoeB/ThiF family protein [Marinitoga hydrogenitolerans]SHF25049.1 Molybdopterin or thiamine biosynthesis adenylyltransferase [Marinitoga hydrogenitolerans DSM 16785]